MPAFTATAPGKIILFGEHAVVYGRPAIAAPVNQVQARAVVSAAPRRPAGDVLIQAPDIGLESFLADLPDENPLACAVNGVFAALGLSRPPACTIRTTSTIPVAAGMGSGAAVSVAIIRALSAFLGATLPDESVSDLAYEVEKLHHGTPSGIDNTVITYGMPVYFVRGQPIETLRLHQPFTLVIGDSGVASPTAITVGDVRRAWQANPTHYEAIFDQVGETVKAACTAIETGRLDKLGILMDKNHDMLRRIGVSSPELEQLVQAARDAGSLGAKLSGGGRGGNMIALVTENSAPAVARALLSNGAVSTITTIVRDSSHV
jgi:mevalonate kinase